MFPLDPAKVMANARRCPTEDLLDRVTVFREAMEPEALEIFEAELARRGIGPEEIAQHHKALRHRVVRDERGLVRRCHRCGRAAVIEAIGWHRLLGLLPLFRRRYAWCDEHRPPPLSPGSSPQP
jgi:hypothetical protein